MCFSVRSVACWHVENEHLMLKLLFAATIWQQSQILGYSCALAQTNDWVEKKWCPSLCTHFWFNILHQSLLTGGPRYRSGPRTDLSSYLIKNIFSIWTTLNHPSPLTHCIVVLGVKHRCPCIIIISIDMSIYLITLQFSPFCGHQWCTAPTTMAENALPIMLWIIKHIMNRITCVFFTQALV